MLNNFIFKIFSQYIFILLCFLSLGCNETASPVKSSSTPAISKISLADLESASKQLDSVVDDLFRSINEEKTKELYENATSSKFREVVKFEKIDEYCGLIRTRLGALKSKESRTFDLNPVDGNLVASGNYSGVFDNGEGSIFVVMEKVDQKWLLLRLNVNSPLMLNDPKQFRENIELFVQESEPVLPGTTVDVVDNSTTPAKVMIEKVIVLNVRWKVDNPMSKLEFPAKGFVTFSLSKEQIALVKNLDKLAIHKSSNEESTSDKDKNISK